MNPDIHIHHLVALLEDTPVRHFETDAPLLLHRGQIGTVVMTYDGSAYETEFAGPDGRAYAVLPLAATKLMRLHHSPVSAAA